MIDYTNEISVAEYTMLRNSAGWPEICPEQAQAGLNGSAFIAAAKDGGKTIGMSRLISDGGYFFIVVDVIVLPEYQGRGIGRELMARATKHIKDSMRPGHKTYTLLTSAPGKEGFYEKMGFEHVSGMQMRMSLE